MNTQAYYKYVAAVKADTEKYGLNSRSLNGDYIDSRKYTCHQCRCGMMNRDIAKMFAGSDKTNGDFHSRMVCHDCWIRIQKRSFVTTVDISTNEKRLKWLENRLDAIELRHFTEDRPLRRGAEIQIEGICANCGTDHGGSTCLDEERT